MPSGYQPLPTSRPTTPQRSRSFNRASPPDSLTLSPASVYSYSETDAFLSPRLGPGTPGSSPSSPYNFFHPPSSPHQTLLLSPLVENSLEKTQKGYFELKLPPTAKRTRKSKVWLGVGAGVAVVLVCVGAMSVLGGVVDRSQLEDYSNRVIEKATRLKEAVSEKWIDASVVAETEKENFEDVELPPSPPIETYEPEVLEVAIKAKDETGLIPISLLPRPRQSSVKTEETRYIGFLPHSGVHNQRIALQNALLLGKLLGRTVLVPPIWIGWPISTEPYNDLAKSWSDIMLLNPSSFNLSSLVDSSPLNLAANYSSTVSSFPCPTCAGDDPVRIADRLDHMAATREKWRAKGYELRADGYPITELTAAECKSYSPECRHTYRDTFMSYDFLVDLDKVRKEGVEIVDRWDMREKAIEGLLGAEGKDIFVINDRQPYDFLFTDRNKTVAAPLISPCTLNDTHWNREVSIPTLSSLPHKVLLFGSLFGGGRIQSDKPEAELWSESFARSMAFKSEWLLRPAEAIVARLGGPKNFVGVHARVGDGEFSRHARQNMEQAWKRLVESLGYDEAEVEEMWEVVRAKGEEGVLEVEEEKKKAKSKAKRHLEVAEKVQAKRSALVNPPAQFSPWSPIDSSTDNYSFLISSPPSSSSSPPSTRLQKRAPVDGDDDPVWNFLRGPSGEPSALLRNLNCRSPLHTDSNLKPLNIPLYLATDSRSPTTDPNLKPFFDAFPCTFILSDFDHPDEVRNDGVVVESVGEMARLENELDGVPLGRLFLPFLEAVVSAKGKITVGTAGSTFSAFATGALHDAYQAQ
ncbi:hypothetical protein JCM16303_004037 [Sporobolomyces ruberrimus]